MEGKLIDEVRKHKCLYRRSSAHFRNKPARDLAWLAISRAIKYPEDHCKARWKSLRDRFVREHAKVLKESEDGIMNPSKCHWEHFRRMMYLEEDIRTKSKGKNSQSTQSPCCTYYSRIEKLLIKAVQTQKVLYDSNHPSFRDKAERQEAWNKISQTIRVRPDRCRKGWKSVRERYATNKSYGTCPHDDIMDFMKHCVDNDYSDCEDEQDGDVWIKEQPNDDLLEEDDSFNAADTQTSDMLGHDSYPADSAMSGEDVELLSFEPNEPKHAFTKIFIENDDDGGEDEEANLPTSSNDTSAMKTLKALDAQEKFETLVSTLNDFVKNRKERESAKSRNHEFYKVLDRYLQKMSEDEQDKMKAEILTMVFSSLK